MRMEIDWESVARLVVWSDLVVAGVALSLSLRGCLMSTAQLERLLDVHRSPSQPQLISILISAIIHSFPIAPIAINDI
jgi:hypothetical protein